MRDVLTRGGGENRPKHAITQSGNCPIEEYSIALVLRSLEGNLDAVPAQNRLQRFVAVS